MNESTGLTTLRARLPLVLWSAALSALGSMVATLVAFATFLVIGLISWAAVDSNQGPFICPVLGFAAGAVMRGPGSRLARVLGGGIGGFVAGYFAIASVEAVPGGTMRWALVGGALGSAFALPVAAILGGFIGLLAAFFRPLEIGKATPVEGRPADPINVDQ